MNNIYFNGVKEIGNLYLEHIFYEFENEPILFLCSDSTKKLYICICSDFRYEQKWVITKCSISRLRALINEEIDIASAFLSSKTAIIITMDIEGNESSRIMNMDKVDRLDLPKEGTFIRCDEEKAQNYLWKKEWEILSEQLMAITNTTPAIGGIVNSYSAAFNTSINLLSKQTELYADSISKEFSNFPQQFNKTSESANENMTVKYKYSISKKEKYVQSTDAMEINPSNDNNNIKAA